MEFNFTSLEKRQVFSHSSQTEEQIGLFQIVEQKVHYVTFRNKISPLKFVFKRFIRFFFKTTESSFHFSSC